jgi:hypothetical protein
MPSTSSMSLRAGLLDRGEDPLAVLRRDGVGEAQPGGLHVGGNRCVTAAAAGERGENEEKAQALEVHPVLDRRVAV